MVNLELERASAFERNLGRVYYFRVHDEKYCAQRAMYVDGATLTNCARAIEYPADSPLCQDREPV